MLRKLGIRLDGRFTVVMIECSPSKKKDDIFTMNMGFYEDGSKRTIGTATGEKDSDWVRLRHRYFICMECVERRFWPSVVRHHLGKHKGTKIPITETRKRSWAEEVIREALVVYSEETDVGDSESQQETNSSSETDDWFPPVFCGPSEIESKAADDLVYGEVRSWYNSGNESSSVLNSGENSEEDLEDPADDHDCNHVVVETVQSDDRESISSFSSYVYDPADFPESNSDSVNAGDNDDFDENECQVFANYDINIQEENNVDEITIGPVVVSQSSTSSYVSALSTC